MKKNKKRVLLVDDHPIMRHGLAQLIRAEADLEVCGEGGSAAEGLALVGSLKPDLVVADLTLPDKHGLEFIKDVQSMYPGTLMLVLSMHDESLYAERVLRAGARGYVMKETAADMLVLAARRVLDGGIYLSDKMSSLMLEMMAGHRKPVSSSALDRLTDRELEVLQLIGQGRATRHIAEQLHVSVRTVDAHRANIKEKLQLADGATLVRYAVRWMDTQAKA
ncbi:response regulator transcription factor [Verrucomicrobium sp. BvORR034]|uniref:response regulator transcription factor n=1 Tax=Verrucomicrobium sp. BvORR034 TaxID=1396418 RepID=UPI00067859B2|nr:response regulator transcription factor [Verrucomicrobium sp. BvORR034]